MKLEIERRFLVRAASWRSEASAGVPYLQAYLHAEPACTVRVRLVREIGGGQAWLTIKTRTESLARQEFEYPIPIADAEHLFALATAGRVEKLRHTLKTGDGCWEIDEFTGGNAGLVLAEIELEREDQDFAKPEWLGEEVTHDRRYDNACLASHPYNCW